MSDGRIIEREDDGYTYRYYESEKGTQYTHFDCERRAKLAVDALARWFSRALRTRTTWTRGTSAGEVFGIKTDGVTAAQMNKHELRQLRYIAERVTEYAEVVARELDRLEGVDRKAARIEALREVQGRTPEEAAMFLAKADQLEGSTAQCS